jgi:hypothetical protein
VGLTGGEWLALGIALGGLATVVSILTAAELERRRRRTARRRHEDEWDEGDEPPSY